MVPFIITEERRECRMITKPLSPAEAAKFLGISVAVLAKKRREGKIQGIQVTSNLYVYTFENLGQADLSEKKRGPKSRRVEAMTS
jgi:predicted site-specific integrase-resolvase